MTCEHIHDSGPYVLGALSPAEREDYEHHLTTCPACRAEIDDLVGLPALLGRLDLASAKAVAAGGEEALHAVMAALPVAEETRQHDVRGWAGPTVVPLDRKVSRKNRNWQVAGAALVAACLAVVAVLGLRSAGLGAPATPDYTAMRPLVANAPVTAGLVLHGVSDGTEIKMQCEYEGTSGPGPQRWLFKLVAVPKKGMAQELNRWTAGYEDQAQMTAHTVLKPEEIQRIELRRADDVPVLVYDVT